MDNLRVSQSLVEHYLACEIGWDDYGSGIPFDYGAGHIEDPEEAIETVLGTELIKEVKELSKLIEKRCNEIAASCTDRVNVNFIPKEYIRELDSRS